MVFPYKSKQNVLDENRSSLVRDAIDRLIKPHDPLKLKHFANEICSLKWMDPQSPIFYSAPMLLQQKSIEKV